MQEVEREKKGDFEKNKKEKNLSVPRDSRFLQGASRFSSLKSEKGSAVTDAP